MNKSKICLLTLLAIGWGNAASAQTAPSLLCRGSAFGNKSEAPIGEGGGRGPRAGGEAAPQIHGILRGKYEYEPDLSSPQLGGSRGVGRFEVRNARLSAEGNMPLRSSYKLEVDLCDESAIKMKDAWVRVNPWSTLRITLGQQRMPFSIDAHRNPSAQYFANRSFIAKQVGDMHDVGAAVGYEAPLRLPP